VRPAYHELRIRGGGRGRLLRNPIVLGRKFCAGCGRWRHVVDFALHKGRPRPRCCACQRAYQRAWHANATPEQRDRQREYSRIWQEAKRREAGIAPRNFHHRRSVIDKVEFVGLPPEPLLAAIDGVGLPDIVLCAAAGVPPRSVYRLRVGESRHVRLDVADKLAHAIGVPLWFIYGDTPVESLRAAS
jgi:hypothetical protein